jgi:hypothetical protein
MFNAASIDRTQYVKELAGPYLAGAVTGWAAYQFAYFDVLTATAAPLMDRVYSGTLSVVSVLVGFAFGFYTLILTRATPFLERVSRNRAYRLLLSQAKEAVFWLLMLTILSGACYFVHLIPLYDDIQARILFGFWIGIASTAVYCWARVSWNTIKVLGIH